MFNEVKIWLDHGFTVKIDIHTLLTSIELESILNLKHWITIFFILDVFYFQCSFKFEICKQTKFNLCFCFILKYQWKISFDYGFTKKDRYSYTLLAGKCLNQVSNCHFSGDLCKGKSVHNVRKFFRSESRFDLYILTMISQKSQILFCSIKIFEIIQDCTCIIHSHFYRKIQYVFVKKNETNLLGLL